MTTERSRLHALVCLICLLSPAALLYRPGDVDGATAMPAGAAIVERVADLLERHHADPPASRRIAERLRDDLRGGVFAGISSRSDLGHRLDQRLGALSPRGEIDVIAEPTPGPTPQSGPWVRASVTATGVGVLDLRDLPALESAAGSLRAALRGLQGSPGLIVDLRGVDGGDPATARHLVGLLLDRAVGGEMGLELAGSTEPCFTGVPVFLLVDSTTAGAAEGLAFALRQARRATLIGEPTAGRAWTFAELEIADGLWLRMPVAGADGPAGGIDWQGVGLFPDLSVPADRALGVAEREVLRAGGEELPPRPLGIGDSGGLSFSRRS